MKHTLILIALFLLNTAVRAHDPDQLSYHFMRLGEGIKLEVHFTPASAFDLLKSTDSRITDTTVIRLRDYQRSFEEYFNKTISLKMGSEPIALKLTAAELTQHDAVLYFDLPELEDTFDRFELTVSSFTEIYRNTKNHVTISDRKLLKQFTLDAQNQVFQHNYKQVHPEQTEGQTVTILLLLLIIIGSVFIYLNASNQHSFLDTVGRKRMGV